MSNIHRLVYIDSNSNQQVLAVQGAGKTDIPNSADADYSIRNARLDRELRNINRLKIWAESDMLGNIPLGISEFEGDEPELFWQKYDEGGSEWLNEFRGYAENKGSIDSEGEFTVKLFSHAKYVGAKEKSVSVDNSSIGAVVDAAVGSNYSVEVPGDVSPPIIDSYDFNDRIENLLQEITRNYGYNIAFTPNTNGSGQYVVRLEPIGYGGLVETIAGKEDVEDNPDALRGTFKQWEKQRTEGIVNKVKVIANDGSNNKISETVTDQNSIDEYGERSKNVKVDWSVANSSEAQEIGNGRLNPDPSEGGKVRVSRIDGDVTNLSFELIDSRRNITGSYTVVQEQTFYPENTTYLVFEYESKVEDEAQIRKNVNEERARLLTQSLQNIGSANVTGDTGDSESDTEVSGQVGLDPSNTDISGSVDEASNTDITVSDVTTDTFADNISSSGWTQLGEIGSVDRDVFHHHILVQLNNVNPTSDLNIAVDNAFQTSPSSEVAHVIADDVGNQSGESVYKQWFTVPVTQARTNYGLYISSKGGGDPYITGELSVVRIKHTHPDSFLTDDNDHDHRDSFLTDDFNHGGPSQPSELQHGVDAETDDIEADIVVEDKTNR